MSKLPIYFVIQYRSRNQIRKDIQTEIKYRFSGRNPKQPCPQIPPLFPPQSSERRVVSSSMGYHGFHKESSPLNRFHKVLDAIHAPPIAYHRWYVQLTFRARDRRYRLGRGRHERWFPRCHIEFHLGIQFRVRMTFFVFLAGWNIAFFRKAFLPSRHGAASYPRWNEIPRPICHRVIRLSFKEKKRSDRIEERKTSRIVFRTRVLKFEYCGVAFKIGRIYSKTVRG